MSLSSQFVMGAEGPHCHRFGVATAGVLMVLVCCTGAALAAPSAEYNFVTIAAGQGPTFWSFGNHPSLNSHGTVAFHTILADTSTHAIYTGNETTTVKVIDTTHAIFSSVGSKSIRNDPTINDNGSIAFGAFTGTNGIWKTDGVTPALVYQPDSNEAPSINEGGGVAFDLQLGSGREGVVVDNAGVLTYIADAADNFSSTSEPVVNDLGKAVFMGQTFGTADTAIYAGNGGALETVVAKGNSINGSAPIEFFGIFPSINNLDQVLFAASHTDGMQGIYRAGAGGIETLVDSAGPFAEFFNSYGVGPAINHQGDIVFYASVDGGGSGLFSGPDPVADRIIGSGDTLFGRQVVDFAFGTAALNDHGQFVFQVLFAEGGNLIVRVDPIPEPGAAVLAALAALALAGLRRVN